MEYIHKSIYYMVRLEGFEPSTYGLEVQKSTLLSCFIFAYTFLHYPLNAFKIRLILAIKNK